MTDIETFTDCFRITFEKIENARRAKKFTDDKNFYGGKVSLLYSFDGLWHYLSYLIGILHVSYAPEYESIDDIRKKFEQRKAEVRYRNNLNKKS